MPILTMQQSQTEVGRIRLGVLVKEAGKKDRPKKIDTFRFTSPRRMLIEKIAELYGGKVEPWQPPRGSQQWQVITDVKEVPVVIPPQRPEENQWLEMWSAGGCQRRCDGQIEHLTKTPCICAANNTPAKDRCKSHTRVNVMLEHVPGLGVWRVDTGSYYAGRELPGITALLAMASGAIPGTLVLHERTATKDGKTFVYMVPTLHVDEITPGQLLSGKVHELITARRAAALDGDVRLALTANVDYLSLVDAANTEPALKDVYDQVKAAKADTPEIKAAVTERLNEIRADAATAAPAAKPESAAAAAAAVVVEGELVPAGAWPEVRRPAGAE